MKTGVFLIPDERYAYCLRVDEVKTYTIGMHPDSHPAPLPDDTYQIICTRCDISEAREPIMEHLSYIHIRTVQSAGPGRWVDADPYPDDDAPTVFEEYGQLSLF